MGNGGYTLSENSMLPPGLIIIAMGAFSGMGLLCVLEVFVLGFTVFRRRQGLYYWSIITATAGVFCFNIGLIVYFFILGNSQRWLSCTLLALGYITYVPAELLVVYSRLHLLSPNKKLIHFVLILAMAEFVLVEIPNFVLGTGALVSSNPNFGNLAGIFQQVEVPLYAAVEIVNSGIYIFQIRQMWGKAWV